MKIKLAIKFGSNEIIILRKSLGIVSRLSSYVATNRRGKIVAYGDEAKRLCELKSSQYNLFEPIQGVEIIDDKMAISLIEKAIKDAVFENGIIEALVAVPCALTEKKLLQLKSILHKAGVFKSTFVQNSVCVRSNLTGINEEAKVMVVDIGKYITDVSVLTRYDFINGRNYLIGGAVMDNALATYIQDNYGVEVTEEKVETIKEEVSSMYTNDMYTITFKGVDEQSEFKEITMRANEARVAIIGIYEKIFDLIEEFLKELPNDILAEVKSLGIIFTGGVCSIEGFTEYASKRLNMPVRVVENPKDEVILGAGKLLSLNREDYPYIKL